MIKRLFATVSVAIFALAIGIFAFSTSEVSAQDLSSHTMVLGYAEYITDGSNAGGIEYFRQDLGNGRLAFDFVYNDPRAFWDNEADITVTNMANYSADANLSNQEYWMTESFSTWSNLNCSKLDYAVVDSPPGAVGLVAGGGGIYADITQVGFVDIALFVQQPTVLGVTYTFIWLDGGGNPTDIDGNGVFDAALREIYYNDNYNWADDGVLGERGSGHIDFPSVAIHEVGHGLSAAHFGSIGFNGNGELLGNPRAIMNAIYGGIYRVPSGRDVGSHCSNWAQWQNN